MRFEVLTPEARLAMPSRSLRASTRLVPPSGGWPASKTNLCFVYNGTNACLEIEQGQVQLPDGPFTVEAWVLPVGDTNGAIVSNIKIGGFSLEVAGTPQFRVQTDEPSVSERRFVTLKPPIVVKAKDRLVAWQWTHLAGVFDGREIALFVDGKKVVSTNASGARLSSDKSLYVGARPNGAFNTFNFSSPLIFWRGAVDDVRVSRGARYNTTFKPAATLEPDPATVFALSSERHAGPFVPLEGVPHAQAEVKGFLRLAPANR